MPSGASPGTTERFERLCREPIIGERPLRIAVLEEIRRSVAFDWYAFLLTDPATEVGCAPLAEVPSLGDLPRLIRAKYCTTVNRWTSLDARAVSLQAATAGLLEQSLMWREVLASYGVVDVASMVFRDSHGCWGWLDLWRSGASGPFAERDLAHLSAAVPPITTALRGAQGRSFVHAAPVPARLGPVALILSPELDVKAQTAETQQYLRALVPPDGDRRPVPAGAYNVAAQLLAAESGVDGHPPSARVHLDGGNWLTLRAARVATEHEVAPQDIAVTIEPASPGERRDLFERVHALSPRESELLAHLAAGGDTRTIAAELFVSEHTIQDHLKSIFAKTGVRNRRTLLSRIAGR